MVGRGEVRRDLAGLTAAKSDETATVGQGGCHRRIRAGILALTALAALL
jgi:hypothetical protein